MVFKGGAVPQYIFYSGKLLFLIVGIADTAVCTVHYFFQQAVPVIGKFQIPSHGIGQLTDFPIGIRYGNLIAVAVKHSCQFSFFIKLYF